MFVVLVQNRTKMAGLGCLAVLLLACTCSTYVIDDSTELGRRFDGIGGLSGGGATSKLLVNYPEKQRNEILDYLFKPNYGASLQILKVEIGGDSQSTDGTESSHMHESWDLNYERGYEWWLMVEAKKRNPDILLYGLPWAFPGWLGGDKGPYSRPNVTANYILRWLQGAQQRYSLKIDYIGIWNERNYDVTYIKTLRATLDENGFSSVRIVAADGSWGIVTDVMKDAELAKAVDVIGVHYPGTKSIDPAKQLGKQLWASEDYSTFNDPVGGGCWARILNQNYVNGLMTSTISWNLIAAYYEGLPFARCALMTADQPWGGYYMVNTPIWVTAHTTQFAPVGWRYLQHGSGVGHLDGGGSYVTLTDPQKQDVTIIIETMGHDHSVCIRPALPAYNVTQQNATFQLKGSLAAHKELSVWYSKLNYDGSPSKMMAKRPNVKVENGTVSLQLSPDELYTITSLTVGQKGFSSSPPAPAPFPLPYKDDFEAYPVFSEASNFAPQVGVWEVRKKSGKLGGGKVNRQVVLNQPVDWCRNTVPINVGGNSNWSSVYVQADVMVPSVNGSDGVFVAARVTKGGCASDTTEGVFLHLDIKNQAYTLSLDSKAATVQKRGSAEVKFDTWYTLTLMIMNDNALGYLDMQEMFVSALPRDTPQRGFVAYGTNRFGLADFDNFMVEDDTFIPRF